MEDLTQRKFNRLVRKGDKILKRFLIFLFLCPKLYFSKSIAKYGYTIWLHDFSEQDVL